MSRRFPLTSTLCLAAVAVGAVLGFANQAPRAHAESLPATAAQSMQEPRSMPPPDPNKAPAGAPCKVTADCQQSPYPMTCNQVGDHKECTRAPMKVPNAPVQT
ncbi:MAG: hypothetical protein JNM83_23375 [Myxococcales bacterium]|nr:hypothetical protein [Myxococcales bacterium]